VAGGPAGPDAALVGGRTARFGFLAR